jgi:hypothetical protein
MKYLTDMQFWIAWIIAAVVIGFVIRAVFK